MEAKIVEAKRQNEREVLESVNIAVKSVCSLIEPTFGPLGKDRILYNKKEEYHQKKEEEIITNDGATILKNIKIDHPVVKILIDVSIIQEKCVGDGTTGVFLLTGLLISKVEELARKYSIHKNKLIRSLEKCAHFCVEKIGEIETKLDIEDPTKREETLKHVTSTSLSSKILSSKIEKEKIGVIVSKCAKKLREANKKENDVDILCIEGQSVLNSEYLEGICFKVPFVFAGHEQQPKLILNPRVILIDVEMEWKQIKENAKFELKQAKDFLSFVDQEKSFLLETLRYIEGKCDVVINSKSIGDFATQFFSEKGIACFGRIEEKEMQRVEVALGVRRHSASFLSQESSLKIVSCDKFQVRKLGKHFHFIIKGQFKDNCGTVILKSASRTIVEEVKRSFEDSLACCLRILESPNIVYGGGCIEFQLSRMLQIKSMELQDSEQIVFYSFSEVLVEIVHILARNCELDPVKNVSKLRQYYSTTEQEALKPMGIFVSKEEMGSEDCIRNMEEMKVWEPSLLKRNAIQSATEAVCFVLSIDQIVINKL